MTKIIATVILCALYGLGDQNVVYYGATSNSLKVSFVDTNLSTSDKALILADLQLCLHSWGKTSKVRTMTDNKYVAYLDNAKLCPHYPPKIAFPENIVLDNVNEYALEVSKGLSDTYTNAFAFFVANSNIVVAAYQFVSFISSPEFVNIPHSDLPNYVLEKNTTATEVITEAEETIEELTHQTYYPPSLLGFIYLPNGPASSNLWVLVPCSSHVTGDFFEWSYFPAIWHDNRWKFGFGFWEDGESVKP